MAKKGRTGATEPRSCKTCGNWGEIRNKLRFHEVLQKAIKQFEAKIKDAEYKPTVAEYVKLLQLGEEFGLEDKAEEIRVTWVTPDSGSNTET